MKNIKSIIKNIIGKTITLPSGDFYHLRFSLFAFLTGKYPWLTGIGTSKRDAVNRANGRPCADEVPPVRVNMAAMSRRADGTYIA